MEYISIFSNAFNFTNSIKTRHVLINNGQHIKAFSSIDEGGPANIEIIFVMQTEGFPLTVLHFVMINIEK